MPALAQEEPSFVPDPVGEIYKVVKAKPFRATSAGHALVGQMRTASKEEPHDRHEIAQNAEAGAEYVRRMLIMFWQRTR